MVRYITYLIPIASFLFFFGCDKKKQEVNKPVLMTFLDAEKISSPENAFVVDSSLVKPYTYTGKSFGRFLENPVDSNGIPILDLEGKWTYYPIQIGQIATTFYKHYYHTGDEQSKQYFLKLAQWMKENFTVNEGFGTWLCHGDYSVHKMKAPWPSAMAQGYGISVMHCAFGITKDSMYYDYALLAINAFEKSITQGGVLSNWNGTPFYEEYPSKKHPSHVLNGFVFSLVGLYDFYEATGNEKAKALFEQGIASLINKLPTYDFHFTSVQNHKHPIGQLASTIGSGNGDHYHELHIGQLLWLHHVTKNELFLDYAHNFLTYDLGKTSSLGDKLKFKSVTSKIADEKDKEHILYDGLWTYGGNWSSEADNSTITILFHQPKNDVSALVFFCINKHHVPKNFRVHVLQENSWELIEEVPVFNPDFSHEIKNASYEDYVAVHKLKTALNDISGVKIQFLKGPVAFREIDIHYDRSKELETLKSNVFHSLNVK